MGRTSVGEKKTPEPKEFNTFEKDGVMKNETVSPESAVFTEGQVGGVHLNMLVDTGSAVTLVHKRVWEKLAPRYGPLETQGTQVVSANGSPLKIVGMVDIEIAVAGICAIHPVLIAEDITHDCLLGVDFLRKHECTIQFGTNQLRTEAGGMGSTLFSKQENVPQICRVSLAETVVIPGRHEMILPAKITTASKSKSTINSPGIVEPSLAFKRKPDIALARSIVQPQRNKIAVRIVNLAPTPVTLYKNSKVGILHPVKNQEFVDDEDVQEYEILEVLDKSECNEVSGERKDDERDIVKELLEQTDMSDLNDDQSSQLEELLRSYEDIFSSGPNDFGRTNKITHKINTGDTIPIRQAPRRLPGNRGEEVGSMIQTMIGQDVIQPSCSPWAAPIVLVKKKDGTTRFCVDYRRLNDVTKKDAYPLPRIDDTLDALAGAKMFSTLDLASGYWQVELDPDDREKTAFVTHQGLYEFNVMPFGLCNAPSTFQRLMEFVLTGLQWSVCLIYLDDVIIFSKNFDDHLRRMEEVFGRLREAGLKLKPQKCRFLQKEVTYLGHVVSENGVSTDPSKVSKILDWPIPRNVSELRSFLGLASYYRRFIKDFAKIAVPLHRLTEKNKPFVWSESCLEAFNELKRELTNHPILAYPDFNKKFILDTDASDYGIGGVLSQVEGNEERVIGYASRSLTKPER